MFGYALAKAFSMPLEFFNAMRPLNQLLLRIGSRGFDGEAGVDVLAAGALMAVNG
jgi:hypothetical protein